MTFHEWHDWDEKTGERRYFRAGKFGRRWHVKTTLKSEPDWHDLDPIPQVVLEELRRQLQNKYQRRRIPYEDVVDIDRLVVAAGGTSMIEEIER
jgi:Tfp pilus assembly PilM family ATPase